LCTLGTSAQLAEPKSPAHHSARGYQNPHADTSAGGIFNVMRSRLFKDDWQRYDPSRDRVPTTTPDPSTAPTDNATVTWIGQATVLIQHKGINVLTDPVFSDHASPFSFAGPKRVTRPAMSVEELPEIHAVVISHNHYDHLDTASIRALGNDPTYFVPLGVKAWFEEVGIRPDKVVELDWWEEASLLIDGQQIVLTATPSQHVSGRGFRDRNATLWASWGIAWSDFSAWFGGDTGYNDLQFREIGERLGPFDLGIIPIGSYEPRHIMKAVHVNPAEALQIHKDINARSSMAVHWGGFHLTAEGVLEPAADLQRARRAAAIPEEEFATVAVGETRHYLPLQPAHLVAGD
jgi:N-acyl-phosphatidylethanolamine-hydrolysing phospholipase D